MPDGAASEPHHDLMQRARRVLPGGTFGNTAAELVIREGRGGRVWDEDGREYIDFLIGSGPMLVGHAHPAVTEAVAVAPLPVLSVMVSSGAAVRPLPGWMIW